MSFQLLTELMTEKFGKTKELDLSFENATASHVKDGYNTVWSDSAEEDLSNALKHAKQELEYASLKPDDWKGHIKTACTDLENYFKAASNLVSERLNTINYVNPSGVDDHEEYKMWDRDAKKLISALASFEDEDVDGWITDVIWRRYRPDDEYDFHESFQPDYRDLFKEIGDTALFYRGNVDRALLWYALMPIDWMGYEEECDEELNPEEISIKKQNHGWANFNQDIELITDMYRSDMYHSVIIFGNYTDMSSECAECFQKYLTAWGSHQDGMDDDCANKIWLNACAYFDSVKKDLQSCEDIDEAKSCKLRKEVTFARLIFDQAKYYYMLSLLEKEGRLTAEDIETAKVILLKGSFELDKAKPLEKYIQKIASRMKGELSEDCIQKSLGLIRAISDCDKILSVLNEGIFSGRVAYYTSMKNFKKMLPPDADDPSNVGKFAVMHVAYMNDPNEGKILGQWIFDTEYETNVAGRTKADYPFVFIKCFTTRIDDLPMWEMYGDHAKGCCIVMDMTRVMQSEKNVFPVYNVCYLTRLADGSYTIDDNRNMSINSVGVSIIQKVISDLVDVHEKFLEDKEYQNTLREILSRVTYLFKNADYAYECEKRIIYSTDSGLNRRIRHTVPDKKEDIPMLYVLSDMYVHIDEIILGPKLINASWEIPYMQESLNKMQKEIGEEAEISISYSTISYR